MIALIVTLACLPLLVIDMLQGSPSSSASEAATSSDSSLVVAAVPSTEESTTTTVVVAATEVAASATTIAPVATTAPRPVQTTTTAPRPVATAPPVTQSDEAFLACVRYRESHNDYTASDPSGTFLGAYQIYQGGWDSIAAKIGRNDLVGVAPNHAAPADQDQIAYAMLTTIGRSPWGGTCR